MMFFDVQAALAEVLKIAPACCDSAISAISEGKAAQKSQESQNRNEQPAFSKLPQPTEARAFAPPEPPAPPCPAPSRPEPDAFPYGHSVDGQPLTWTGRVVSLDAWNRLSDWERHGSTGKAWNGITRAWEPRNGGAA